MHQAKLKQTHYWPEPAPYEPEPQETVLHETNSASPHPIHHPEATRPRWFATNTAFVIGVSILAGVAAAAIGEQLPAIAGVVAAVGAGVALVVRWGFWVLDNVPY